VKTKSKRLKRIGEVFSRLKAAGVKLRKVQRRELMEAIVELIDGGKRKYGKDYFRPSLDTMVVLLAERQHIETSLRTLSRAIRNLVDEKAIWRKNRHTRGKGIKMLCRTTAYYVLYKGREMFRKMLQKAQRFLRPLGVPKVASDIVPREQYYSSSVVLGGILSNVWPIKGRASPLSFQR